MSASDAFAVATDNAPILMQREEERKGSIAGLVKLEMVPDAADKTRDKDGLADYADVPGGVLDGSFEADEGVVTTKYRVYKRRWLILAFFVIYSASNSMQWTQYTIIQDIVTGYYGVASTVVSWTAMLYMVMYVPFIFPASWLLDKSISVQNTGSSSTSASLRRSARILGRRGNEFLHLLNDSVTEQELDVEWAEVDEDEPSLTGKPVANPVPVIQSLEEWVKSPWENLK